MAKKKTEIEKYTYCDHCEHYGSTKVCDKCVTVFNEETQEYLTPTKYKHVETENGDDIFGDEHTCGTCMFAATYYDKQPCKKCIEGYKEFGCRSGWIDGGLEVKKPSQEKIDEAFKKKCDMIHPTSVDNVNHPHHYEGSTSIECIQAMTLIFGEDTVADFCACNAFKYMWRYKNKNGMEDLKKAEWYLNKIEEFGEKCDQGKIPGYFMNITAIYRRLRTMLDELMKKEAEK